MKRPIIKRRSDLLKLFRRYNKKPFLTSKFKIVRLLLHNGVTLTNGQMSKICLRYGARIEEIRALIDPYGYDVLVKRVGKTQTFKYRIVKTWRGLTW
jgi:hypothetical protein